VGSLRRAGEFVADVGFALLFPKPGVALPSLWEAASDRPLSDLAREWGPDVERVWGWKDELPRRGLAWYGRFLRGHPSFLAPDLLADLYPRAGRPEDFEGWPLSADARRVATVLLLSGPLPSSVVRRAAGLGGRRGGPRFSSAVRELGRALVVTHFGTDREDSGWPSAVLELTARAFRVPSPGAPEDRDLRAARRFLGTMVVGRPSELALAFGWSGPRAREALDRLVEAGQAVRSGRAYRAVDGAGRHGGRRDAPGPDGRRSRRLRDRG
jgi:hypothetical protein